VFLPSARKLASVRNTPAIYRKNVALTPDQDDQFNRPETHEANEHEIYFQKTFSHFIAVEAYSPSR
jgi:hypothetical protein